MQQQDWDQRALWGPDQGAVTPRMTVRYDHSVSAQPISHLAEQIKGLLMGCIKALLQTLPQGHRTDAQASVLSSESPTLWVAYYYCDLHHQDFSLVGEHTTIFSNFLIYVFMYTYLHMPYISLEGI